MKDAALAEILATVRKELAQKTKPAGALDRIDDLVLQVARAQHSAQPQVMPATALVFAADHGISRDGVSAYPREVTAQMVLNIAAGGAAVCTFAQACGANVQVYDVGVDAPAFDAPVHDVKIARGTQNIRHQAAMTENELAQALQVGHAALHDALKHGAKSVVIGEMGIGNTASASALAAALLQDQAALLVGPGTGVVGSALEAKIQAVQQALDRVGPTTDAHALLRELGGFEIAAMAGVCLAAVEAKCPVIVDGFISSVAAMCAAAIDANVANQLIWGHRSEEPGHDRVLAHMNARPILDLQMRLGEGSGAVLALPVLHAACVMYAQMATFASAAVSNREESA